MLRPKRTFFGPSPATRQRSKVRSLSRNNVAASRCERHKDLLPAKWAGAQIDVLVEIGRALPEAAP